MKERNKLIMCAILFGGMWGFAEATLGYLLNLSSNGISGCVMFPIGYMILKEAYNRSKNIGVIYGASLIAGMIKLVNLLMPISHPVKVINPAFAIVLEGISVAVLVSWSVKKNKEIGFGSALITSLSWRIIYFIDAVILFYINIPSRMIQKGPVEYLGKFIIVNSLVNAILIYALYKVEKSNKISTPKIPIRPITAVCSVILAISAQIITKLI